MPVRWLAGALGERNFRLLVALLSVADVRNFRARSVGTEALAGA